MSERTKHILMLPSWYLPEGGHFCRNQAQELTRKGLKCNVLANVALPWKKYKRKLLQYPWHSFNSYEDGLTVFRYFFRGIPRLNKLNGILWSRKTVRLFHKYCQQHGRPDIIHVHSVLWGGYAAYLIKKKTGIPYIITEHKGIFGMSCDYARKQFFEWQTPYMSKAFSNANGIIAVSSNLIPKIKTYLYQEVPISIISNMVDCDFFFYKERKASIPIQFVAVNGFSYVKAYDILLPAFDNACDIRPDIRLRIVGEDFEGETFEKLWKEVKNKDKITFTGEMDMFGVRKELWKASIFVISSRVESQSVSALEALSTGLPMICTDVIPDYVSNPINSIRVPIENIQALTSGIIEMAENFTQYNGAQIAKNIRQVADKDIVSSQLIETYLSLCATS